MLLRSVDDAVAAGDLKLEGYRGVDVTLGPWTLTLGTHTLVHSDGFLEQYNVADPYGLMLRHLHLLLNGMGWKPLVDVCDEQAVKASIDRVLKEVFPEFEHNL